MKLLLIEDEPHTQAYLQQGLTEAGFVVDVAGDGELGLVFALGQTFAAIVLDIQLPRRDGWAVLARLRDAGCATPVLCLTARDSVPDRVRGLELGADDYLVKPFAFSELLARIRSLLRRRSERPTEVLRVADLEIDLIRHRASRGGVALELRPKEFQLLALLTRRSGEVLTRTLIVEQVWDANFDYETNVVDVQIKRLREAVDEAFEPKLIHTVRGVGYVLEPRA
jgi:two-component system, OmpR family, copper resistance phosphate regulon response regulator CusR